MLIASQSQRESNVRAEEDLSIYIQVVPSKRRTDRNERLVMGFRFDLLLLFTTLVLLSTTTSTVLSDVILSKVDRRVSFAISDILFS